MKIILTVLGVVLFQLAFVWSDSVFKFERPNDEEDDYKSSSLCPNNRTKCPETGTCCKTKHNSYHCCRYRNAVCCADLYHCCPHGSTCDTERKKCNRNVGFPKEVSAKSTSDPMEWVIVDKDAGVNAGPLERVKFNDGLDRGTLTSEATCPNNKTICKDTKTCCITKHGNYYCCPHKNAVCCSDKWSCCPEGTTCDVENKKCLNASVTNTHVIKPSMKLPIKQKPTYHKSFIEKFVSLFVTFDTDCPRQDISCHVGEKCCPTVGGKFGCCIDQKGVCCPNLSICCPHGTQCDDKSNSCTNKVDDNTPVKKRGNINTDICPDGKSECFSWETCCPIGNSEYGCCPKRNATCCIDQVSCCPHNSKCDVAHSRCVPLMIAGVVPFMNVVKRLSLEVFLSNVGLTTTCPDNTKCKGNNTCCPIAGRKYGCCGYNSGICCADMNSCCPTNTTCSSNGCVGI